MSISFLYLTLTATVALLQLDMSFRSSSDPHISSQNFVVEFSLFLFLLYRNIFINVFL